MSREISISAGSRRAFFGQVGRGVVGAAALHAGGLSWGASAPSRPRVAAVLTEFTYRSHGHVILENFLNPYLFNGKKTDPQVDVVGLYIDQFPANDIGREIARQCKIPIYPTIAGALCLGGKSLAVDAVLSIGEHGNYPVNVKGQREYPRKRFFDEIVAVFADSGRVAPVFNDKHLSYRWDWALEMVETARRMKFPFMAGSSVPLAQRRPPFELASGAELRHAVSIHGGPVEAYDYHGLEVLQSMVEARKGGEAGVKEVQFLTGKALIDFLDSEAWPLELAQLAMAAELGAKTPPVRELVANASSGPGSHGILIRYVDGLNALLLKVGNDATRWNFATKVEEGGHSQGTSFYVGPWNNRNLFKALAHAIQSMFVTGKVPYPVERTLLTTGILDAAMDSRLRHGEVVSTPQLQFAYQPTDFRSMREMGATWEIITKKVPEPKGLDLYGLTPPS